MPINHYQPFGLLFATFKPFGLFSDLIAKCCFRLAWWGPVQRRYSLDTEDTGDTFTDLTRLHPHQHPDGGEDDHPDLAHGR